MFVPIVPALSVRDPETDRMEVEKYINAFQRAAGAGDAAAFVLALEIAKIFLQRQAAPNALPYLGYAAQAPSPEVKAQARMTQGLYMRDVERDFGAARRLFNEAGILSSDSALQFHANGLARGCEAVFSGSQPDIAKTAPRFRALANDQGYGVTPEALDDAAFAPGALHDRTAKAVRMNSDMEFALTGTLIRDNRGRIAIRDETTGTATLLDHNWAHEHMENVFNQDMGKVVTVSGTFRPSHGHATTGFRPGSVKINYYGGPVGNNHTAARAGFRLTGADACLAVQQHSLGQGVA